MESHTRRERFSLWIRPILALGDNLVTLFGAGLTTASGLTMVGFWGTHDGRSWLNDYPVKGRTNHPLLFDRDLQPKPAFDAVIRAATGEQLNPR